MALWLFRRKSRRKRSRSATFSGDDAQRQLPRSQTAPEADDGLPARQKSVKKQRTEPNKLQRRARTYSFETGRRDSIHVGRKRSRRMRESAPPLPHAAGANPAALAILNANMNDSGQGMIDDDVVQDMPTLHANKRNGHHLMPRKSSKRRKNSHDREREAELKAISNFRPYRPATDAWTTGRPMKTESRRVHTGLGLSLRGSRSQWDQEHRSSDVSLPIPGSVHSSMSSDSEQVSYKVSTLDALAPKPTLRYAVYPRWGPPSGGSMPARIPSQRRKLSEKEPIPPSTLRAHKRIDDLADDLSASDLRELMERDQRRREKKRQREQEKLDRKLARRQEKQRQAVESGGETPPNLERGVLGREHVGLGIETTSAVVTSSKRRASDASSKGKDKQVAAATAEEGEQDSQSTPLSTFHRTTSIPLETEEPEQKAEDAAPPTPTSAKLAGFLRSKKSRSKSPLAPDREAPAAPEKTRKGSESSSSRGPKSWAAIFRWGNKNRRNSGPSSFSNTSRDSMNITQQQPTPSTTAFVPLSKMSSGVPKRTLSRFREDLPDFVTSPSDTQDVDHPIPPPIVELPSPPPDNEAEVTFSTQERQQNSSSDQDALRATPTSWGQQEPIEPSPEPQQSMSLASIDSEASWLSGRVGNQRTSSQRLRHRDSASQSNQSQHRRQTSGASVGSAESHENETAEDSIADIADDEYLNRYARHSSGGAWASGRKSTGEARPSSDEEDDARWGSVGGRLPNVVHGHAADRIKSREGLLNTFGQDDEKEIARGEESETAETADLDSPISPVSIDAKEEEAGLQRATSINLGQGHARHISAGDAKLLELSPRNSVDTKGRPWEARA